MPITSAEQITTLNPGGSITKTNFKGVVHLTDASPNFEATYSVRFSGKEQKGSLSPQEKVTINIPELQKEVEATNASKEATLVVAFVPI
jgi:hypothetical protein